MPGTIGALFVNKTADVIEGFDRSKPLVYNVGLVCLLCFRCLYSCNERSYNLFCSFYGAELVRWVWKLLWIGKTGFGEKTKLGAKSVVPTSWILLSNVIGSTFYWLIHRDNQSVFKINYRILSRFWLFIGFASDEPHFNEIIIVLVRVYCSGGQFASLRSSSQRTRWSKHLLFTFHWYIQQTILGFISWFKKFYHNLSLFSPAWLLDCYSSAQYLGRIGEK